MGSRGETVEIVLEDTGIRKALRALEWVQFNIPRATTALGVVLLAGLAGVQFYLVLGDLGYPLWLTVYHCVLIAGWAAAAILMMTGRSVTAAQLGWFVGDVVAAVYLVIYLISRIVGLPGAPYLRGWWDFAAGTLGMLFALGFLGGHASILAGVMIARPQRRGWRD
ncbi:MAG TPA: oxidoreductase [Mycobacterium sp.]